MLTRLLIVEDDLHIRHFIRIALQDEGFQVFEAETIKQGLLEANRQLSLDLNRN